MLLCEAGQDTPPGKEPPEIADSYPAPPISTRASTGPSSRSTPRSSRTTIRRRTAPPLRKYEQARVLGGGSSINGQMANRGAPTDYDEWASRGAEGWGWNDVLPYFKKVERDLDFDGPYHGKDGRIPVRRIPPEHWTGHAKAVAEASRPRATSSCPTRTASSSRATSPSPIPTPRSGACRRRWAISTPRRASARTSRSRPTPRSSRCCSRARAASASPPWSTGKEQEFRGREVILSSGAIHTPAHLMRAGIGPVGHLSELGIPVRCGLPGVGQRLMDHPSIALSSFIRRGARMNGIRGATSISACAIPPACPASPRVTCSWR